MMMEELYSISDHTDLCTTAPDNDNVIELTEAGIIGLDTLCRLCANRTDHLIPIYDGEGVEHELEAKINRYLPFKIERSQSMPVHCCYQCASTVLAWHELVEVSLEANRRLKALQEDAVVHLTQKYPRPDDDTSGGVLDVENTGLKAGPSLRPAAVFPRTASLISFRQAQSNFTVDFLKKKEKPKLKVKKTKRKSIKRKCKVSSQQPLKKSSSSNSLDSTANNIADPWIKVEVKEEEDTLEANNPNDKEEIKEEIAEFELTDIKEDSDNESSDNVCNRCGTIFPSEEELSAHMNTQHVRTHRSKRTTDDTDAIRDAMVVIEDRTYYECKECGKKLHSSYTYLWHRRIHTGEKPFVCDLCGKQFRVSQGLVRHLRETHAGIKNFPCDLCGRMFATRRNVAEHRRIHTDERPYVCDLCGKAFKQKASLFVHNRSHSNSFPFECTQCGLRFRTRAPLMVHVTRHTGEKPHECDICGRRFRIKYELKRHRLVHSDVKPFSCMQCGVSFRQKRYLRNHNKTNHGQSTL